MASLDACFGRLIAGALSGRPAPSTASCGFDRMPATWAVGPRAVPEPMLYLLLDGWISGVVGGRPIELGPLTLLWLPQGLFHRMNVIPGASPPLLYFFRPILPASAPFPRRPLIRRQVPGLRGPCAAFHAAMTEAHPLRELRIRATLGSLLAEVADALRESPPARKLLSPSHQARMRSELAHAGNGATPAGLARALGLAPRYFTRRFTATFGAPPRVWLLRERLRRAAQALVESNEPIAALADRFGFADPFRFSRAFKQLYGASPRAWRAGRRGGP